MEGGGRDAYKQNLRSELKMFELVFVKSKLNLKSYIYPIFFFHV